MDLKEIKNLITLIEKANISSFSIEEDNVKIEIKKETLAPQTIQSYTIPAPLPQTMSIPAEHAPAAPSVTAETSAPVQDANVVTIKSPMVGTFYSAPSPDAPIFVKVGDSIDKGTTVCIIEAMKLFNEIESEFAGTVEKILVKNGEPVEYGQPLFEVRL